MRVCCKTHAYITLGWHGVSRWLSRLSQRTFCGHVMKWGQPLSQRAFSSHVMKLGQPLSQRTLCGHVMKWGQPLSQRTFSHHVMKWDQPQDRVGQDNNPAAAVVAMEVLNQTTVWSQCHLVQAPGRMLVSSQPAEKTLDSLLVPLPHSCLYPGCF